MTDAFGLPTGHRASDGQGGAMYEAAANLVAKAVIALEAASQDKAISFIRRAGRLPYDDGGAAAPLALAAHMYVLQTALDVHELGGGVWVDAADLLLSPAASRNPLAVADFRHVMTVVQHDYRTTQDEDRKLRALIRGRKVATIREMQGLVGEELCAVAVDLLELAVRYGRRAAALVAEREAD